MSDSLASQHTHNTTTTAPASTDNQPIAESPTTPPPENTAIAPFNNHPATTPEPLSHNVSQCPTLPNFLLIQSSKPKPNPKPKPAPPNPEDLPQYEPAQPPPDGESLTPLQNQAIHLLLQGLSDSAVARRLNLNRKTIHRWKWYTPLFYNTLDEAQRQAWNEAYGLLRSSILQSAHTLNHLVKKGKPQQALQAARLLLSNTLLTRLEG